MSIEDINRSKKLRRIGEKMGRAEIAERILAVAKQIVEDGSYKNAVAGAGRMAMLAHTCGFDSYWAEKRDRGKWLEELDLEYWEKNGKYRDRIKGIL